MYFFLAVRWILFLISVEVFLGHRMNCFSSFKHFYDIKAFKVVLTNRQIFEAEDTYYFYRNYLQKLYSWLGNITHSPCQTTSFGTARLRSPDLRNGCPWRLIKRNSFPRLLLIQPVCQALFSSKRSGNQEFFLKKSGGYQEFFSFKSNDFIQNYIK